MPRLWVALWLLLVPRMVLADSPPPDNITECIGKDAGAGCYTSGCSCVELSPAFCSGGGAACLVCQTAGGEACGKSSSSGCATGAPVAAALAGFGWLLYLRRRLRT
jgi:hypothetical protein